jgi:hypothetical protein
MKLDPGFASHWKTERLIARCGHSAVVGLLRLWGDCQIQRRWSGLAINPTKLAAMMRYEGDHAALWEAMTDADAPWLDPEEGGTYAVHDFGHHQKQVIHMWENGRKGGRPRKEIPPTPPKETEDTIHTLPLTPLGYETEPNGYETKPNGFSVEVVIEAGRRASIPEDVCRAYHDDREGAGWLDGKGRRVSSMPHDLSGFWRKWQSNRSPKQFGNGSVASNGAPKATEGVWHLEKRMEAARREIDRIQANPDNKMQVEDSFDRVLKPEHHGQGEGAQGEHFARCGSSWRGWRWRRERPPDHRGLRRRKKGWRLEGHFEQLRSGRRREGGRIKALPRFESKQARLPRF